MGGFVNRELGNVEMIVKILYVLLGRVGGWKTKGAID
jgi:hypothetical protein